MFQAFGQKIVNFFQEMGEIMMLTSEIFKRLFKSRFVFRRTVDQMMQLGLGSISMTITTAIFVGMAFTIQVTREFLKFGAGDMIGGIVGLAIWRELGPLITGVVVCGRVGAAISAELASMKVTEQVDALKTLSQNVVEYLVIPRFLACVIMMPLLVGLADIMGFLSGFVVAMVAGNINPYAYFNAAESMLTVNDITGGLIKAAFFGMLISIISSYQGLKTQGGAKGVGDQTTKAVVMSLIAIFITNYFLSVLLF